MSRQPFSLLLGRAGTGKSSAILDAIAQEGQQAVPATCLLLVPETVSHETERLLCAEAGDRSAAYAEVITFKRLAARLPLTGHSPTSPIDSAGRQLILLQAFDMARTAMKSSFRTARSSILLPTLLQTIDELQRGSITADALLTASQQADSTITRDKLYDLSLLLAAYEAAGAQLGYDTRELLTQVAEALPISGLAQDVRLFVDGFVTFTAAELAILRVFFQQARDITAAFCCDNLHTRQPLFTVTAQTAQQLCDMATQADRTLYTTTLTQPKRFTAERLKALEAIAFNTPAELSVPDDGSLTVYQADDVWQQCEIAAATVAKLIRDGARYRDIAVTTRHIEGFIAPLTAVFERYGIPIFAAKASAIIEKPILSVLLTALSTINNGFGYESVFAYLRTGLSGLTTAECDVLEDYVLRWQPRGWTKDWYSHPHGYCAEWNEDDHALLNELNRLRAKVSKPLLALKKEAASNPTARGQVNALYSFMEALQLAEQLRQRADKLTELGEPQLAAETAQLWDIACRALEQCHYVLGDKPMTLPAFAELLKLVLTHYSVGTIPVSLDSVTVGGSDRLRKSRLKHLILLEADEDMLTPPEPGGLLGDDDRIFLEGLGHTLSLPLDRRLNRELFTLYSAVTLPSDSLTLCIPSPLTGRSENYIVGQWRQCFSLPALSVEALQPYSIGGGIAACRAIAAREGEAGALARAVLRSYGGHDGYLDMLRQAAASRRDPLSPSTARALYSDRPLLSATRMNLWQSCRFQYFMQYGLRAATRPEHGFNRLNAGLFTHSVIERTTREVMRRGGFLCVDMEDIIKLARTHAFDYLYETLPPREHWHNRMQTAANRLVYMAERIMENVAKELKGSQFQPLAIEYAFEKLVQAPSHNGFLLRGIIDRIDGYIRDGTLYLRVVDYKTGKAGFSLNELYHGLSLQLFVYTMDIGNTIPRHLRGEASKVQAAGLLYVPARVALSKNGSKPDDALRRSGLLLNDPELLTAMEPTPGERFLPKREDDAFVLTSLTEWGQLSVHIEKVINELAADMGSGSLEARPLWRNGRLSCEYCGYRASCQYDRRCGDGAPRYYPSHPKEEIFHFLEKGGDEPCN